MNKDDRLYWYWIYIRITVPLYRSTATTATWNTTNYPAFVLSWFVASLLSMNFVWAVLMYFYTIVMYHGPLNAAPCHVDSIRHRMATNCSAPSKPILDRTRANDNEVATSLLSMQCVWAMVICFYTITTKCNDALNTFYCHADSIRHEMVVACCSCLPAKPHCIRPAKSFVASVPSM